MTSWTKRFVEHKRDNRVDLSVAFTWDLPDAYQRAVWFRQSGFDVHAGGPAVSLLPDYLSDVATCNGEKVDALPWHNPNATFTSRGCIRACPFCAVPKIEGHLVELEEWPIRPIICDNNLLACSRAHFDRVIDRLKPLRGDIDFNQGLDARLLTRYHADRLAELKCMVRLAFDSVREESSFMCAYHLLRDARIPKKRIRVYVLVGFRDTPEDALYRLSLVRSLGLDPNPMRYNPLDALKRDRYVGPGWTAREMRRFVRYWHNLRYFGGIPFAEFTG